MADFVNYQRILLVAVLLYQIGFSNPLSAQEMLGDGFLLKEGGEVTVEGKANFGGFKCYTSPVPADPCLTSCFSATAGKLEVANVLFNIPVDEFSCGNPLVLRDLKSVLQSDDYPTLGFVLHDLVARDVNGDFYQGDAKVTTTVRGQRKVVMLPVEIDQPSPGVFRIVGQTIIKLSWYGINAPSSLFGLLTLEDDVHVCFEVYFYQPK